MSKFFVQEDAHARKNMGKRLRNRVFTLSGPKGSSRSILVLVAGSPFLYRADEAKGVGDAAGYEVELIYYCMRHVGIA